MCPKKADILGGVFLLLKRVPEFLLSNQEGATGQRNTHGIFCTGCRYRIFESSNAASCLSGAWNHGWHQSCYKVQPSS